MPKKFSLTKSEIETLTRTLGIAQIQEDILNAITQSYRFFILDKVFKRIGAEEKDFKNTIVNINTGELIIEEPKKPKDEKVQK